MFDWMKNTVLVYFYYHTCSTALKFFIQSNISVTTLGSPSPRPAPICLIG